MYGNLWKFFEFQQKGSQKWAEGSQREPKGCQKVPKVSWKGANGSQKGSHLEAKGAKSEPTGDRNASTNSPPGWTRPSGGVLGLAGMWFVLHAPFPAVGLVSQYIFFFSEEDSILDPSLSLPCRSFFGHLLAPFWLKVGCRVFVMFFWSVFGRFLTCFWLVFGVHFTCFSHPCSNCVFAYFFLGCFPNVCTLSKHGMFKKHCFSRVKTLFWRNRLCRRNLRILIFGDGIVPCFLLIFQVFWRVFRHRFPH